MARLSEIYPRGPQDPNYKEGFLHTNDDVEILIGMIKNCMLSRPGEVLALLFDNKSIFIIF